MPSDDDQIANNYTYNALTNDEKDWVSRNGYQPDELSVQEVRRLMEEDSDTDANSEAVGEIADEMDGTDADAS